MIISRELDYALRIIRNLSETELVAATELEQKENIPVAYVRKIVRKLSEAGIVEITRGVRGGYLLRKSWQELTIWSVSVALEESIYMNECLEPGYQCNSSNQGNCGIHRECLRIQSCLEQEMSKASLAELFAPSC